MTTSLDAPEETDAADFDAETDADPGIDDDDDDV